MNLVKSVNLSFKRKLSGVGVDIGGTLTKVVGLNLEHEKWIKDLKFELLNVSKVKHKDFNGNLVFIEFPSNKIEILDNFFNNIKPTLIQSNKYGVCITGGGSLRYKILDRSLRIKPELDCLVNGLTFSYENYLIDAHRLDDNFSKTNFNDDLKYPFLISNIGSGVSIIKVDGKNTCTRVAGTSTGGATFMGLCQLLTDSKDFKEAIKMAEKGDNTSVDLLVKDIYGESCEELNLDGNLIAASFGKVNKNAAKKDLARSLLMMTSTDIGLLTAECALREKINEIFFTGNFLKFNNLGKKMLQKVVKHRSQNLNPIFLNHEGYFGALGALLYALDS